MPKSKKKTSNRCSSYESNQASPLDSGLNSDDDSATSTLAVPIHSLVMGHALQYPRNVASALITVNVGNSSEAEESLKGKCGGIESYRKDDAAKYINKVNCSIQNNATSKKENTIKDICREENKNATYIENKQKLNSDNNKNVRLKAFEGCNVWQPLDELEHSLFEGQQRQINKYERRKLLEERFAKSLEVAQKEADSSNRNSNNRSHNKQELSASARKRAEEKWNSKLATLTLQVQRPSSAKSAASFSYNLVSPTSSAQPSAKNVHVFTDK